MYVFVVQEAPKRNLTKAQRFGTVRFVLPADSNIAFDATSHIRKIEESLADYSEGDYLMPIGDPAAIGIATHILLSRLGKITLLKWDNRDMDYYPVEVDMSRGELSSEERSLNQRRRPNTERRRATSF